MEFALSEQQKMMQDSVDGALTKACPLDRVRGAADGGAAPADDVWRVLADLGIAGVLIPEAHGGLGLGLLEAALIAETLGKHVAPVPFVATAVMAPLALMAGGTATQQARWLPKLASGEVRAAVAVSEYAGGARENAGVSAKDGRLSGKALFAIDFAGADIIIVADRELRLHLVLANAAGLTMRALPTIDRTRSFGELVFDGVAAEPLAGASETAIARISDAGRVMLAADTLGAGWTMINKAVAYAKERRQFGRIIASFQAVKHLCAEMAAQLEPGRALVWYAAYALDLRPDEAPLVAAHAKSYLGEAGRFVARTATEVHGGIGITDMLGLHYWYKRIGANRPLLGSPEHMREQAARLHEFVA
ncbi:acyl-CoA dehydrogenase family protein [Bradyrhizobium sp. LHD-71]|uniref:acyl-CoA dehydrogenase family protein n=1 Tax=Bradyrhizobium sp. LHD-71 TaxID=3072141 RepID=UPI00280D71BD|nr:acyl-CoA dehydrogenase family protein [Bradyrhizobium sp. LHD-71]MDQ8730173.1 acyl-CoA dehydrogenase family protein [Bradyrhizobium sp. LHD-71]